MGTAGPKCLVLSGLLGAGGATLTEKNGGVSERKDFQARPKLPCNFLEPGQPPSPYFRLSTCPCLSFTSLDKQAVAIRVHSRISFAKKRSLLVSSALGSLLYIHRSRCISARTYLPKLAVMAEPITSTAAAETAPDTVIPPAAENTVSDHKPTAVEPAAPAADTDAAPVAASVELPKEEQVGDNEVKIEAQPVAAGNLGYKAPGLIK